MVFFDNLKKEYQNGFCVRITEELTGLKLITWTNMPGALVYLKSGSNVIRAKLFLLSLKAEGVIDARYCI